MMGTKSIYNRTFSKCLGITFIKDLMANLRQNVTNVLWHCLAILTLTGVRGPI